MNKQNTSSTRPAPLFASLADLKRANIAAGGQFFEPGKGGHLSLVAGRWVVLSTSDRSGLWLSDAAGRLAPVLTTSEPWGARILDPAGLAALARSLGSVAELLREHSGRLAWKSGQLGWECAYLSGSVMVESAYGVAELLRGHGFRLIEASDDQMPYAAAWASTSARAVVTYAEGDIRLTVCTSARAWALELAELTAFYRAPVTPALDYDAPRWESSVEPDESHTLREVWLYAENDGDCYRAFMDAVRPLVRAYVRGEHAPRLGARVFSELVRDAASRYRREFGCSFVLDMAEVRTWAAYQASSLTRRLWAMRRGEACDWRGVTDLLKEECRAYVEECAAELDR